MQNKTGSISPERTSTLKVYFWILSFVKPYIGLAVSLVACGIIIASCELAFAKIIQHFIDVIYPNRDYRTFINWCIGLGALALLLIFATLGSNVFRRKLSEHTARDLQFTAFQKTRELGIPFFESRPTGHTLSLLNNEVASIQEIYKTYLPTIIQFSIFSIISLLVMITTNAKLTLLLIPIFVLYYLIGPYFAKKAIIHGKQAAEHRTDLNKQVYDSVSALSEFRAYGRQKWNLTRHMEKITRYLQSYLKMNMFSYLRGSVRRFSNNAGAIGIIAYGAYLTRHNELTVGEFVVFLLIYFYTIFVMTKIISLATEQRQLMFQGEILYRFLNQTPEVVEDRDGVKLPEIKGDIVFKDVHFSYKDQLIINGLNLHIRAGEKIAIVGASGSGKSTLLKLIPRFYDPNQGSIELDGVPIARLSFSQLRDSMGYVFQDTYLFGKSIRENIRFGNPDATEEEIIDAAKAAHAYDFIFKLPEGLDTLVGERGVKLSGGQRQRLSISRMFIKKPSVILLDEATSALDNISEKEVQLALDHLMQGRTTIVVAHRLTTIRNADRIIVLEAGEVVESGTYDELIDQRGALYELANGKVLA
ncbi:hypothetical protein AK95_15225 [Paenibacillus sp. LC231]|uniref:ABC transporter ATP-binding protein n=1 Tax=Paenibacillus sp. LC231 TaxID=1120679 RepID=UPI0008DDC4D4|nr:ABC transporter ATP-binding protein [Paenibacillus sp. LC231]OIB04958.1 hypothetical protein AK95_15225 [Paenibacillus sp. LC231]